MHPGKLRQMPLPNPILYYIINIEQTVYMLYLYQMSYLLKFNDIDTINCTDVTDFLD